MEDFDLLYLMKTPFFLGSMNKVIEEGEKLELSEDDVSTTTGKTLLLIRTMAAKCDINNLKLIMTSSLEKPQTQSTSQNSSRLMQYIFQGTVNQEFINATYDQAIQDISSVEDSAIFVLVYYFALSGDSNRLLCLLHETRNME